MGNARLSASLGCAALTAVFAAIILKTFLLTGHWYYPLDDAYIDMSIAKHLALNGVWGISGEFASAASSPGYIILLEICYRLMGVSQYTPLVLAFLGCVGIVFATAKILRDTSPRVQTIGILFVVALTPLWTMAALGMEHALQILLCLIFLDQVVPAIASSQRLNWKILLITAMMVSIRYEGLFVAAGACVLLLIQRRWRSMFALAVSAWLPVFVFGLYFRLHGAEWLPNSILLKGGASAYRILGFLVQGFYLAPLMLLVSGIAWKNRHIDSSAKVAVGITTVALWMHLFFADYGWVYRYEAYLIALGIVSLTLCYSESLLSPGMQQTSAIAIVCLVFHALLATGTLPGRSEAIYMQQVQTAELLRLYPVPTALNDIGAPTYFTDTPMLDLVGLGSQDVFNARYHRPYTTAVMQGLLRTHGIKTLAVYDSWFSQHPHARLGGPPLPSGYVRVAELYTPAYSGYLGGKTVSYYAATGSDANLRAALHRLQTTLPAGDVISFTP